MTKPISTLAQKLLDISTRPLSAIAAERLQRDLTAVIQRLEKGEYETSSITQNAFDVPDATAQFYAHLKTYTRIGKTWQSIFQQLPVNDFSVVLDLCPGAAPKVELGLFYSQYQGTVVLLDQEKPAKIELQKLLELFEPQFTVEMITHDLFQPLGQSFGFVAANHIIDDLILFYFAQKQQLTLKYLYQQEAVFTQMWQSILENEEANLQEVTTKLGSIFEPLISPGGYLCLTQYQSYMERMLDLAGPAQFSARVLALFSQNLQQKNFTKIPLNELSYPEKYFTAADVVVLQKKR